MPAREGEGQNQKKYSPVDIVSRAIETFSISSFFSASAKYTFLRKTRKHMNKFRLVSRKDLFINIG